MGNGKFFQGNKTLWNETFKELSSDNKEILKLTESEQMILNIVIKLWNEKVKIIFNLETEISLYKDLISLIYLKQ